MSHSQFLENDAVFVAQRKAELTPESIGLKAVQLADFVADRDPSFDYELAGTKLVKLTIFKSRTTPSDTEVWIPEFVLEGITRTMNAIITVKGNNPKFYGPRLEH